MNAQMQVMQLTPSKAKELLQTMIVNRPLRPDAVADYARHIAGGKWVFSGEPLKVDDKGHLIDGQHRCNAVIKAGKPIQVCIVYGIKSEVFRYLDRGRKRTGSDALHVAGHENATTLQGALSTLWRYLNNRFISKDAYPSGGEELDLLEKHPKLTKSISIARKVAHLLAPSKAAFLHYLASKADEDKADQFFERLYDGQGLGAGHPILILRNRLIKNKTSRAKVQIETQLAWAILAWNAFISGKRNSTLKYDKGTEFPRVTTFLSDKIRKRTGVKNGK